MDSNNFICRNQNCNTEHEGNSLVTVPENPEGIFSCPKCGQNYLMDDDKQVYTVFKEKPFEITSLEQATELQNRYSQQFLHIDTLHLKDISDSENFSKILAFTDCQINKLYIENVDLYLSCFPILFNQCHINSVSISNSKIQLARIRDFWAPQTFFGINFNQCKLVEELQLENYTGDIIFRGCKMPDKIPVKDSAIEKFAIIETREIPKLILTNSTISKSFSSPPKGTDHKVIEELKLVNDSKSPTVYSNSIIGKLVFESSRFDREVTFVNCYFLEEVDISRVDFSSGLSFELCRFEKSFTLLESQVTGDLHLSYSYFGQKLKLEYSTVTGHVVMHQATVVDKTKLERFTAKQNLTFGSVVLADVSLEADTFIREMFLNQSRIKSFDIRESNLHLINLNKCWFSGKVTVEKTLVSQDFVILSSYFHHDFFFWDKTDIQSVMLINQASFYQSFDLFTSTLNMVYSLSTNFYGAVGLHSMKTRENLYVENNFCKDTVAFNKVKIQDIEFKTTVFSDKLDFNDVDGDDILLTANQIPTFEFYKSICGEIRLSENDFGKVDIYDVESRKQFNWNKNIVVGLSEIAKCKFSRSVSLQESTLYGKLEFDDNIVGNRLLLNQVHFKFNDTYVDLVIQNNEITSSIIVQNALNQGKIQITGNNLGMDLVLENLDCQVPEVDGKAVDFSSFEKGIWISENMVNHLKLKSMEIGVPMYFDNNTVSGSLSLGETHHKSFYNQPISIIRNRIRALEMDECNFSKNICLFVNHIEGNLNIANSTFSETCDLSGTYVGGSAILPNVAFSNHLILDNSFFDKRLEFRSGLINNISFTGATIHGFDLPGGWHFAKGHLLDNTKKKVLIDEQVLLYKKEEIPFTYQMACNMLFSDPEFLQELKSNWRQIVAAENKDEISEKEKTDNVKALLFYQPVINQLLKDEFYSLYYGFTDQDELELLKSVTSGIVSELKDEDVGNPVTKSLLSFCENFGPLLYAFDSFLNEYSQSQFIKTIKPILFERLQDQYLTIKEVYGENGDLGDEDRAYFRWMHYKNLYDYKVSSLWQKPIKAMKWLLFEQFFGWGVDLFRIFGSTLLTVLLFSVVYLIGGQMNPDLSILWDDETIPIAALSYGNILLLTFQTTFAAFMGDWSPAGLGPMKVWMTINAVIGVLLVAFLIGAYGRKMLR